MYTTVRVLCGLVCALGAMVSFLTYGWIMLSVGKIADPVSYEDFMTNPRSVTMSMLLLLPTVGCVLFSALAFTKPRNH